MAVKEIVKIWDEEGNLIPENINHLHKKTRLVNFPLSNKSKTIIQDLKDTYEEISCAGIAANQIGYNKSIFIGMETCDDEEEAEHIERMESEPEKYAGQKNKNYENMEIYINPKIISAKADSIQKEVEGCLSMPDLMLEILRSDKIMVKYFNENGNVVKKTLKGFISKLFQHELDHLSGILMIDDRSRVSNLAFSKRSKAKILEAPIREYVNTYIKE